jgi:hypothetical protein
MTNIGVEVHEVTPILKRNDSKVLVTEVGGIDSN